MSLLPNLDLNNEVKDALVNPLCNILSILFLKPNLIRRKLSLLLFYIIQKFSNLSNFGRK